MTKKKKRTDMQVWVMGTVIVLVIGLGIFGLINQFMAKPEPQPVQNTVLAVDYKGQPSLGKADAPVKVMEFGDYKCPYCKQFHDEIFPKLKKEYIDTGKVQFFYTGHHVLAEDSVTAGMAAMSVYKQNPEAFWKFYDAIFKHQGPENKVWATTEFLVKLVKENIPEVDAKKVEQDLKQKVYEKEVNEETMKMRKLGLQGIPQLLVNGKLVDPFDYAAIKALIEKELQKK